MSRTLESAGTQATLVSHDIKPFVRRLKTESDGIIDVSGPELTGHLSDLGLIDE